VEQIDDQTSFTSLCLACSRTRWWHGRQKLLLAIRWVSCAGKAPLHSPHISVAAPPPGCLAEDKGEEGDTSICCRGERGLDAAETEDASCRGEDGLDVAETEDVSRGENRLDAVEAEDGSCRGENKAGEEGCLSGLAGGDEDCCHCCLGE